MRREVEKVSTDKDKDKKERTHTMPIFIQLTTADGKKVMVNSTLVNLYGAVDEGNGRNTMLDIDGTHLYVQESMEEISNRVTEAVRKVA